MIIHGPVQSIAVFICTFGTEIQSAQTARKGCTKRSNGVSGGEARPKNAIGRLGALQRSIQTGASFHRSINTGSWTFQRHDVLKFVVARGLKQPQGLLFSKNGPLAALCVQLVTGFPVHCWVPLHSGSFSKIFVSIKNISRRNDQSQKWYFAWTK